MMGWTSMPGLYEVLPWSALIAALFALVPMGRRGRVEPVPVRVRRRRGTGPGPRS